MTDTDTRERIAAHVEHNPGVHFSELVRDLDLAPGQVQYHLRRLDASGTDQIGRASCRERVSSPV